ncbi:MAG TPA: chloramphenicol acetyltransferase [Candidatus Izemoplasmatales bacterium]|nr:chloramphenicol acetyltransferase [Candidatus Izemoplasmatales bacterium]
MIKIDLDTWPRKKHFMLFKDSDQPHFGITFEADVTPLVDFSKTSKTSFFAVMLHAVMTSLNQIPEFRYRIRPDGVILHDIVSPSYTVLSDDDLFYFVTTDYCDSLAQFVFKVQKDIEAAKIRKSLDDVEGKDDIVYISSLPWFSFTSLTHPSDTKHPDSFPRISWDKYRMIDGKAIIHISVSAHHALCDGIHIYRFISNLKTYAEKI